MPPPAWPVGNHPAAPRPTPPQAVLISASASLPRLLVSRPFEQCLESLRQPANASLSDRRGRQTLNHHEAIDLAVQERVEKLRIVSDRHASIRLSIGPKQVGMRKDTVAAE